MHVHLSFSPSADFVAYLRQHLAEGITLTFGDDVPDPASYRVLIHGRPTPEFLDASPNLDTLIIPFAGLPTVTQERLRAYPQIRVYNLHHNAAPTAEMAITLMLAAAKNLVPADRIFRQHDWTPRHAPMPAQTLAGKTALILGYGRIGQRIGAVCAALGMQVIGIKRTPSDAPNVYPIDALAEHLPKADVLHICAPLTPQTEGLLDAAALALLPSDAIVVNVGRAAIVDEQALYEALHAKKLFAAGFDVWYQYPETEADRTHTPPSKYPFHELDHFVMSPHRAGGVGTPDVEYLRMDALADMLNAAFSGDPIPNPVDLDAGY